MVQLDVFSEDVREDFNSNKTPEYITDFKPEIQELIRKVWACGGHATYKECDRWKTYRAITDKHR
jgi:hypothetical protein